MIEKETDLEIADTDNFGFSKSDAFSHQALVMLALRKCLESGSTELRLGWFNEKTDKQGNTTLTYIPDTRKAFIESVKSLLMIVACDLDTEADKKINDLQESINKKKGELIQKLDNSWNTIGEDGRAIYSSKNKEHILGFLDYPQFQQDFINFEIDVRREMVAEISRLTKRLDFYKGELIEA